MAKSILTEFDVSAYIGEAQRETESEAQTPKPQPMAPSDLADSLRAIPKFTTRREHTDNLALDQGFNGDVDMWQHFFASWLFRMDGPNKTVTPDDCVAFMEHIAMHDGDENAAARHLGWRSASVFKACAMRSLLRSKLH